MTSITCDVDDCLWYSNGMCSKDSIDISQEQVIGITVPMCKD